MHLRSKGTGPKREFDTSRVSILLTIPEIANRPALKQDKEEIKDRVGEDHRHGAINDDFVYPYNA
jgi:hypothetical protein